MTISYENNMIDNANIFGNTNNNLTTPNVPFPHMMNEKDACCYWLAQESKQAL